MRIQSVGYTSPAHRAKKKSGGSGFTDALPQDEEGVNASTASSETNALSLDGFLALQENVDSDQQAQRQGHHMLDMLEGLRLSILSGSLTLSQLNRLQSEVDKTVFPQSPVLQQTLDDIKLRVRVEVAKLKR